MVYLLSSLLLLLTFFIQIDSDETFWEQLDLPDSHIPYYLFSFPDLKDFCLVDTSCKFKKEIKKNKCWGYESECKSANKYSLTECPTYYKWMPSKESQMESFYRQTDFGYVKDQLRELSLICEPQFKEDSSLECSEHLRFCRGRNIMINFTSLATRTSPIRYNMDVLSSGDVGGHCRFNKTKLQKELDHLSPLQSWAPELQHFKELSQTADSYCELIIEKPTFIMKIDATINMYHHFCDFFNLYLSQHVNLSHPDSFSNDVRILIWETYPYFSNFAPTWEAFTKYPVINLNSVKGKIVCFKNVVFPLLPRMIFGLFYNTPITLGCEKSGLFKAFSEHILHRLKVPLLERKNEKIRITFLSRNTTYRNVLNEDELLKELKTNIEYKVRKVIFNREVNFKKQLQVVRNSDIFIGMHGAGLTHLLFLPDWAVVFELYNCEDENCYKDLARLKGVKYITWENKNLLDQEDEGHHPEGGAHAKFTNYRFDVKEFMRLVTIAAQHVKQKRSLPLNNKTKHDEL